MTKIDFEELISMRLKSSEWVKELRAYATENKVPIIRPLAQNVLETIISIAKPIKVLEIGTAIGFSAAIMYEQISKYATPNIITLEKDSSRVKIAKKNFDKLSMPIDIVEGDAINYLTQCNEKFDFIFLDGPKGQYDKYLQLILNILKVDGVLFCDNLYQDGFVTKSRYQILRRDRTIHTRMEMFIDDITNNDYLQTTILSVADGIAICRRKG